MLIWAAAATIICIILILIIVMILRQIDIICRCLDFIKYHKTNLLLPSATPLGALNRLIDNINGLLSETAEERRAVEKEDRSLKESLTGISHDIRTPLTSLSGYFQLLEGTEDPGEQARYSGIIKARIKDLETMLENLFSYTKLQDSDYALTMTRINFTESVIDTTLAFYGQFSEKGITPRIDMDEAPAYIRGNPEAVRRILQNILKNALDHGTESIAVSLHTEGRKTVFQCANKCKTPDEIDISGVFTKFYKADPARTDTSTGLGLTIARELAERLDGELKAALEGDIFTITAAFPINQGSTDHSSLMSSSIR